MTLNRPDRRAQEARTRDSFADYSKLYRKDKSADDRAIGEGFMRGARIEAKGIDSMILHPPGEPPPPREACDLTISASYGSQRFVAYAKTEFAPTLERDWVALTDEIRKTEGKPPGGGDMRACARGLVLEMLVTNEHLLDGDRAALLAAAIVWLAETSPVRAVLAGVGKPTRIIHYEITDNGPAVPAGSGGKNFRLMLG
jgi:hypothetical protein